LAEAIQKISIDELPKYTPWVARILGLEHFARPVRDIAKIDAQYDRDIYAKLLAYQKEHPDVTPADIRRQETIKDPQQRVCFSMKGVLYVTSANEVQRIRDKALIDILAEPISRAKVVVELGCGYGYNLSLLNQAFPHCTWIGGEYSNNGVRLAERLFTDDQNISVIPFNYYDPEWSILENLTEEALVITVFSIGELPQAAAVMPTFLKYKDKIAEVIHLEPAYELLDNQSTLDLMRRSYIELNNYNTDLLTALNSIGAHVIEKQPYFIGTNPLCPISLIRWQFAEQ
jgi:hypothetical protein